VWPVLVVVAAVDAEHVLEMPAAEDEDPVEAIFGVAVALLLDATLIRSVLLPSAMTLLSRWNWYLPRWLEWLPQLQLERPSSAVSEPSRR
jgi:uncharacterized membrane protein YdfJ with MMPL/SSD domain